jgi:hypothetical protein
MTATLHMREAVRKAIMQVCCAVRLLHKNTGVLCCAVLCCAVMCGCQHNMV